MAHQNESPISDPQPELPGLEEFGQIEPYDPVATSGRAALAAASRAPEPEDVDNPRAPYMMGRGGETGTTELPPTHKPSRHSRSSRRGGRSFPEKSGRDVGREMDNAAREKEGTTAVDPRTIPGYMAARALQAYEADVAKSGGDPREMLILSRNREVRSKRDD